MHDVEVEVVCGCFHPKQGTNAEGVEEEQGSELGAVETEDHKTRKDGIE